MTYFTFVGQFLLLPIIVLIVLNRLDARRGRSLPPDLAGWPAWAVVLGHMGLALVYAAPWDSYMIATGVWWYDPDLLSGLALGRIPVEEYLFFILQPVLAGLWLVYLARRLPAVGQPGRPKRRPQTLLWLLGLLWLAALLGLASGWRPGTYLCLTLVWALPPIALQLGFGGDILWSYRRLIAGSVLPVVLYLSLADALAIRAGVWTIDPAQTFQVYLGGVLPIEEFIFFLITNTLLVFGMTLFMARESQVRAYPLLSRLPWLKPVRPVPGANLE